MVELWMEKRAEKPRRPQTKQDAVVYRLRMMANLTASRLRSVILRLATMYGIPSVHPLESLTPISRDRSAGYGVRERG
jgi:hypothetical protein